jgi:hypothetical protein
VFYKNIKFLKADEALPKRNMLENLNTLLDPNNEILRVGKFVAKTPISKHSSMGLVL